MIPATWSLAARVAAPLLVLAVAGALIWGYGRREYLAGQADADARHTAAALAQAQAAAAETARRITTIEEARRAAELRTHQALADAAAAGAARDRLRQQLDAYVRAARADPAAAGGSAPAGDAIGVLADVLGRADARAGELAAAADAARGAGQLCERAYDALSQ
ncbi:MAG TPA: DUF2514 family protein [Methylibium sp.]|nr:DUF2514 family protein [Methylibium sp.]